MTNPLTKHQIIEGLKTYNISARNFLKHNQKYKNDYDIILNAIKQDPYALQFASTELKDNAYFVKITLASRPDVLKFASPRLQNDISIVTMAIQEDGDAIEFASEALKNNKDVVMKAVKQDGMSVLINLHKSIH